MVWWCQGDALTPSWHDLQTETHNPNDLPKILFLKVRHRIGWSKVNYSLTIGLGKVSSWKYRYLLNVDFFARTILFYPVVVWLHMRTRAVTLSRWARQTWSRSGHWLLSHLRSREQGIFYKGGELVNIFLGVQNIKIRQNRRACPTGTDLVLMFKNWYFYATQTNLWHHCYWCAFQNWNEFGKIEMIRDPSFVRSRHRERGHVSDHLLTNSFTNTRSLPFLPSLQLYTTIIMCTEFPWL